ncbi:MAG TPA: glycosyltransferase family 2 protein [Marmoricola sp.]|nr:glycosyltransferase family 2 protein [Marmoricola sp.]
MTVLSVVVPMYNEQDVLPLFVERLRPVLDGLATAYEVVAVDDGSKDLTPALLQRFHREWPELRVLRLRANSGHQAAISAGLQRARGAYVVTIDADLQDPPEVIASMLAVAQNDQVDVVYGVRTDRSTDTAFKRVTAGLFYSVIRRMSGTAAESDAGDFRLMSRATVDAVNSMPDDHRVLRLIVPALAFPSGRVEYKRDSRAAGESKYPLIKMLKLSLDAVTGFSTVPLRFATLGGLAAALVAVFVIIYAIVRNAMDRTVPGWASTSVLVAGFASVQLISLGILGEYIGRMYVQMQGRPTYFIASDTLADEPE